MDRRIDTHAPELPTLGGMLRRLRSDRRLSREKLGFAAGVSASYITHLESGVRDRPAFAVLDALMRCMSQVRPLTRTERRHLMNLAEVFDDKPPSPAELRAELTEDMLAELAMQDANLMAYIGSNWQVLACNQSFIDAHPGLEQDSNLLQWLFTNPAAKELLTDWEEHAELTVAWIRGWLGRHSRAAWLPGLIEEFCAYPDFRRFWDKGTVSFLWGKRIEHCCPDTGELKQLHFKTFHATSGGHADHIHLIIGTPLN
ncbi:helix-turn-helix transcriptional regulator [Nocardia huaxiensis]|uniref:Helix-turn-helix domain-containing protein n=1 Tax=Nocardia huaxiensis TaxID=2755382 RepID=A0A7D6VDF4_9NOCA|nr:helix-turn-helix transcriptional regulator [Nocardia huaxiensis]QLY33841.1 helix-turn-helix domain-containing protein [Nocardia huaxiensis]UFS99232.1 helix-turn-helix transcriptional regulator [Nocardia huaxiensis]